MDQQKKLQLIEDLKTTNQNLALAQRMLQVILRALSEGILTEDDESQHDKLISIDSSIIEMYKSKADVEAVLAEAYGGVKLLE